MTHYSLGIVDKPTSGADPTIIYFYDPLNDGALPGGSTFTRASVAEEYDGVDFDQVISGAIRENSAAVGAGAKGYLPEPAATNQFTESNDYNDAVWTLQHVTATDIGVSDIGFITHTLTPVAVSNVHRMYVSPTPVSGSVVTISVIAKAKGGRYLGVRCGAGTEFSIFDVQGGTITETGSGISSDSITSLGNGWYRCVSSQITVSGGTPVIAISDSATPGQADPTFNDATLTLDVAHCQAEETAFATSPIITSGSTVTRVAEVLDTDEVIASAFGALLDVTLPDVIGTGNTISLLAPDATAEDVIRVDAAGAVIMDDGGTPATIGTATLGTRIKVSYGRDGMGRSGSLDGATVVTGDAPGAGHEGDTFQLGCANSVNQSRCIHHTSTLFNVKKSDAELESLAT